MSTKRYSGDITIRITYLEPWACGTPAPSNRSTRMNGEYRCFLRAGKQTCTVFVGAPAYLEHGVDSPEAFDEAASAAIAFADDETGEWSQKALYDDSGIVNTRKQL